MLAIHDQFTRQMRRRLKTTCIGLGLVRLLQDARRFEQARTILYSLENGFQGVAVETDGVDAAEVLGSLMGKDKGTLNKPASKKKEKPILYLEGNEAEVFDTFIAADAILKVAKSGQELAKSNAAEIVKAKYIHMCAEQGYPQNV